MAMIPKAPVSSGYPPKRVRRGRLMAGIALHFLAPAYGLALIGDAALGHAPATWALWLPHALALGWQFLLAYGGAALLLTLLAGWSERLARPKAEEPEMAVISKATLAQSLARAKGCFGAQADALIDHARQLTPDYHDSQTREIVCDIARLLEAGHAALAADAGQEEGSEARTIAALEVLVCALEQKAKESALLAHDEVHVLANYVTAKYGEKID